MRRWKLSFRRIFVAGLLVTLPAVVTAYVLWVVFAHLDGILQPVIARWLPFRIPGVGLVALITLILLVGLFASHFIGERVVRGVTARLERIPLWSPVYRAVRDISEVFLRDRSTSFRQVGLISWPRPGLYAMVFVTSDGPSPGDEGVGRSLVSIFLPTTPNPTSGFYMMVPRDELIYLDLSVEQALKVIISGGAAYDPRVELMQDEPASSVPGRTDSRA
ncbi:MAG: DUF502 domain-containing protein [Candidatus Krumholzibacteriia bacterium]